MNYGEFITTTNFFMDDGIASYILPEVVNFELREGVEYRFEIFSTRKSNETFIVTALDDALPIRFYGDVDFYLVNDVPPGQEIDILYNGDHTYQIFPPNPSGAWGEVICAENCLVLSMKIVSGYLIVVSDYWGLYQNPPTIWDYEALNFQSVDKVSSPKISITSTEPILTYIYEDDIY